MPGERDRTKRWRPRFSVRTLVVLVTLVGIYFGCWEITTRYGVPGPWPQHPSAFYAGSTAPLIIVVDEHYTRGYMQEQGIEAWDGPPMMRTNYYVWLFGPHFRFATYTFSN